MGGNLSHFGPINGKDVKDAEQRFARAGKFRVAAFVGTVVGICPCGSPEPLTMPVIPGAGGVAQCSGCGTMWFVEGIDYTEIRPKKDGEQPKPPQLNVKVHGVQPRIVLPPKPLI